MDILFVSLGIIAGLLFVLVVGVFVGGRFLPERYEATFVIELPCKSQEVWDALMDIEKNPVTGSMCKRSERLADVNGMPSWLEDMGSSKIIVTTEQMQPPSRLRRRFADQVVPMTAESDTAIEETATGCRVTASVVNVVRLGTWHVPFFRVILLFGGGKSGLRSYWKRLARGLGKDAYFGAKIVKK